MLRIHVQLNSCMNSSSYPNIVLKMKKGQVQCGSPYVFHAAKALFSAQGFLLGITHQYLFSSKTPIYILNLTLCD